MKHSFANFVSGNISQSKKSISVLSDLHFDGADFFSKKSDQNFHSKYKIIKQVGEGASG
jgi:hypothetical protein